MTLSPAPSTQAGVESTSAPSFSAGPTTASVAMGSTIVPHDMSYLYMHDKSKKTKKSGSGSKTAKVVKIGPKVEYTKKKNISEDKKDKMKDSLYEVVHSMSYDSMQSTSMSCMTYTEEKKTKKSSTKASKDSHHKGSKGQKKESDKALSMPVKVVEMKKKGKVHDKMEDKESKYKDDKKSAMYEVMYVMSLSYEYSMSMMSMSAKKAAKDSYIHLHKKEAKVYDKKVEKEPEKTKKAGKGHDMVTKEHKVSVAEVHKETKEAKESKESKVKVVEVHKKTMKDHSKRMQKHKSMSMHSTVKVQHDMSMSMMLSFDTEVMSVAYSHESMSYSNHHKGDGKTEKGSKVDKATKHDKHGKHDKLLL
jgi:hypothetical protein